MEADVVWRWLKGKGKGKGKGTKGTKGLQGQQHHSKSQGKGKGQQGERLCCNCGRPGHEARQCWAPKQGNEVGQGHDGYIREGYDESPGLAMGLAMGLRSL